MKLKSGTIIIAAALICACNSETSAPVSATKAVAAVEARITAAVKPARPARKFKVGDCVLSTSNHEAWQTNPPRRIRRIGTKSYLAPSADPDNEYTFETLSFYSMEDGSYVKVRCPR